MKKYLCITATNYNLLLFCLLKDFLGNTVFWVSPNLYRLEEKDFFLLSEASSSKQKILENKRQFQQMKEKYLVRDFFEIYAQDHILPSYSFIKTKFFMIEDGTMTYLETENEYMKDRKSTRLNSSHAN